jgi:hypothetical protein
MLKRATAVAAAFGMATTVVAAPQFIEQSRIMYPRQAGELALIGSRFDEQRVHAGVTLTYELPSSGIKLEVNIYPAGRMDESAAMQSGVAALRSALENGMRSQAFSDFRKLGERKLDLEVHEGTTLHGRLLSYAFATADARFELRALLFYRFDYYIEVRAGAESVPGTQLDQAVVRVAADLVPAIRVANRGDCSLSDGASIEEQVARYEANTPGARRRRGNSAVIDGRLSAEQVIGVATPNRIADQQVGCVPSFKYDAAKPRKGEEYVTISFPDGYWHTPKSQPAPAN